MIQMMFFVLFLIIFAPAIFLSSFLGIFIPHRFIYAKEHFSKCWLKHGTMKERFWHFLDTRGDIATFTTGHKVLKHSPNRNEYLKRERDFLGRQINEDDGYFEGYKEYCMGELNKVEAELSRMRPMQQTKDEKPD